jgi:hypothetical protein
MATITILDVEKFVKGLAPVKTTEYLTKTGEWTEDGLFSEKIFGVEGSLDRQKVFAYIDLNAYVMHPMGFKELVGRIDRRLENFFSTEESFSVTSSGELFVDPNGVTGINALKDLFPKIKFKGGTAAREKIIKLVTDAYKSGTLFINKLPVIPPHFRPAYQDEANQWIVDELNEVYIKIMRQASQIKSVGSGSALYDLLNYRLQLTMNEHDAFVKRKVQKKSGLVRGNMMGKRVDYSGRAVITPGPKLNVNEVGLPLRMAVTLFDLFLKHYLIFSKKYPFKDELEKELKLYADLEYSVDSITRVIKAIKDGDKIPEGLKKLMFDACEVVMKDRVILAKRDPALHEQSYRALIPVLVDGISVQMPTLQVGGFNADFDGDTMAFYHPLSNEAQKEAKEKMMKPIGSKTFSDVTFELSKEMAAGIYTLTKPTKSKSSPVGVTQEMLEKGTDPYIPVTYRGKQTTLGRAIFNSVFPPSFPFIDKPMKKGDVNALIPELIKRYGEDETRKIFSQLSKLGFKFATIIAPTMTLDNLQIPDSIKRIKEKLKTASPDEAQRLLDQAQKILTDHLKGTGFYDLVESGASKGWKQPMQILVAKGVIADPKGNVLDPIEGSFSDGLKTTEFFNAASGSRKGMADRALNTADTGYFTRQLVYFLSPVEASPRTKDCKTKRTVTLKLTNDLIKRLRGRNVIFGGRVKPFNPSDYSSGDMVNLRTPIYCESPKICHTCYGDLLKSHRSPYIGIIAATSIGERGTQLIMRTFHTGGATEIVQRDLLGDIIDNDPMIRLNKSELGKYLQQNENTLSVLRPCKLTLDMSNYEIKDNIQIEDSFIWVKSLLCQIEFDDLIFKAVLDYPIQIQKIKMVESNKRQIVLDYVKGDTLFEIPMATDELKSQVNYVGRLIGGKEIYKDPGHLLLKVLKVYQKHTRMDLVHFEVLISQTFRDRSSPEIPARLARKWDPVLANIKNNIFASGFIQGLAFENINKAIETGLISDQFLEKSVMEKLLTGDLMK